MELKQVFRALIEERADLCRGLLLVLVFRPAAYLLPRSLVWKLALGVAAVMVVLQSQGRRMARDFATCFGLTFGKGLRLAIRSHAKRFNAFAIQQKIIAGWYRPDSLPARIEANEEILGIIAGPGSVLVAQSHFERTSAAAALYFPETFDHRPTVTVAINLPRWIPLPHLWRASVQLRQVLRACRAVRPEGFELIYLGGAVKGLLARTGSERLMVSINVDAHWARDRSSSLERPFCGWMRRCFSVGTAKLSRMGNIPLVLALPVLTEDNQAIRIRLFGPFTSSAASPELQDLEVTNAMLDIIEREVGNRPCDYALEIGGERRWDAEAQSWQPLPTFAVAEEKLSEAAP